jgi:hypothetical protein
MASSNDIGSRYGHEIKKEELVSEWEMFSFIV